MKTSIIKILNTLDGPWESAPTILCASFFRKKIQLPLIHKSVLESLKLLEIDRNSQSCGEVFGQRKMFAISIIIGYVVPTFNVRNYNITEVKMMDDVKNTRR